MLGLPSLYPYLSLAHEPTCCLLWKERSSCTPSSLHRQAHKQAYLHWQLVGIGEPLDLTIRVGAAPLWSRSARLPPPAPLAGHRPNLLAWRLWVVVRVVLRTRS
jgi:hypothetical protein